MAKYQVTVRRIIREDTVVSVDADTPEQAQAQAELEATCLSQEAWDTYDCEYSSDALNNAGDLATVEQLIGAGGSA